MSKWLYIEIETYRGTKNTRQCEAGFDSWHKNMAVNLFFHKKQLHLLLGMDILFNICLLGTNLHHFVILVITILRFWSRDQMSFFPLIEIVYLFLISSIKIDRKRQRLTEFVKSIWDSLKMLQSLVIEWNLFVHLDAGKKSETWLIWGKLSANSNNIRTIGSFKDFRNPFPWWSASICRDSR